MFNNGHTFLPRQHQMAPFMQIISHPTLSDVLTSFAGVLKGVFCLVPHFTSYLEVSFEPCGRFLSRNILWKGVLESERNRE